MGDGDGGEGMTAYKFFIISACAVRVRVRGTDIEVVHGNGRLIMSSPDEAYQHAMQQALAYYPPGEGWTRHEAVVNEIPSDELRQMLDALVEDAEPTPSQDDDDVSETVM